jgi:hypothetical protein
MTTPELTDEMVAEHEAAFARAVASNGKKGVRIDAALRAALEAVLARRSVPVASEEMVEAGYEAAREYHREHFPDEIVHFGTDMIRKALTAAGQTAAPVAFITKAGLDKWLNGDGPENHVLLRTGGGMRVPLYATPVAAAPVAVKLLPAKAPDCDADDADLKAFKRGWNAMHDVASAALATPVSPAPDATEGCLTDVVAMSGSVESDRVLQLHFKRPVTDADRQRLLDLHNDRIQSAPAPDAGWREAFDEMLTALEPFADKAARYDPPEGDDSHPLWGAHLLTIGDVRRARAAMLKARAIAGGKA